MFKIVFPLFLSFPLNRGKLVILRTCFREFGFYRTIIAGILKGLLNEYFCKFYAGNINGSVAPIKWYGIFPTEVFNAFRNY